MEMEVCENPTLLGSIAMIKVVLNIIFIAVPIILIVILTFKFAKLVLNPDGEKKELGIIVKKIIYASVVFLIPFIVNLAFSLIGIAGVEETECWTRANSADIDKYAAIRNAKEEEIRVKREEEEKKAREEQERIAQLRLQKLKENLYRRIKGDGSPSGEIGSGYNDDVSGGCKGHYVGTKYDKLSDDEITHLARIVYKEYSTDIDGMKAVASHMANLYEIREYYGYTKGRNIHDYITTCGWYGKWPLVSSRIYNPKNDNEKAKQAVIDVLVNGNRTLPLYIDEYDWFPNDIVGARSLFEYQNYTPGVTQLANVYGATGTYYCATIDANVRDGNIFFYTPTAAKYKAEKRY